MNLLWNCHRVIVPLAVHCVIWWTKLAITAGKMGCVGKLICLLFSFQSYIATQIMVDSKMLRGHRQDGKHLFFGFHDCLLCTGRDRGIALTFWKLLLMRDRFSVLSPIKLTQDKREFWFQFCNFYLSICLFPLSFRFKHFEPEWSIRKQRRQWNTFLYKKT